jgi:hypothetical protein
MLQFVFLLSAWVICPSLHSGSRRHRDPETTTGVSVSCRRQGRGKWRSTDSDIEHTQPRDFIVIIVPLKIATTLPIT